MTKNKEQLKKALQYQKEYRAKNRDKIIAYGRQYRANPQNQEKIREYRKRYLARNKEKLKAQNKAYRARKKEQELQATIEHLTKLNEIRKLQRKPQ